MRVLDQYLYYRVVLKMSNEELVAAIQAGQTELIPQLWGNVEKLIAWRANSFLAANSATDLCRGVEIGDLVNSGFFAVLAAVKTYDPTQSKFSSWLLQYLRTAFAEAVGCRTEKQKSDPLRYAMSIDAPIADEEGDALGDLQADPNASVPFENVDDAIYVHQLHQALEQVVSDLPEAQAEVIRRRYWGQQTLEEIGVCISVSTERARQLEEISLRTMAAPPYRNRLENFLDWKTPYYLHVGPHEFQRTRTSSTEKIILIRERMREKQKGINT